MVGLVGDLVHQPVAIVQIAISLAMLCGQTAFASTIPPYISGGLHTCGFGRALLSISGSVVGHWNPPAATSRQALCQSRFVIHLTVSRPIWRVTSAKPLQRRSDFHTLVEISTPAGYGDVASAATSRNTNDRIFSYSSASRSGRLTTRDALRALNHGRSTAATTPC